MAKKGTQAWYRKKCVNIAKEEAKKIANYTCERCGRSKRSGYAMHGSHVYPEGTYVSMSALVENIICLCYLCHFQWWHKNPIDAAEWFRKTYADRYIKLKERSKQLVVIDWKKTYEGFTGQILPKNSKKRRVL